MAYNDVRVPVRVPEARDLRRRCVSLLAARAAGNDLKRKTQLELVRMLGGYPSTPELAASWRDHVQQLLAEMPSEEEGELAAIHAGEAGR